MSTAPSSASTRLHTLANNGSSHTMTPDASGMPSEFAIGNIVNGRYRIVGFLGEGGMGVVFKALHLSLGREFAIKTLRKEYAHVPEAITRFQREVAALALVRSGHVVDIVDRGITPSEVPYFVMELLEGRTLRNVLRNDGAVTLTRAVNLGLDVCLGLAKIHALGLVHRDLKPENLYITRADDGRELTKILDLGVARSLASGESGVTHPGGAVGTTAYMAPEQALGQCGPSADVFALGLILYECLSGFAAVNSTYEAVELKPMLKVTGEHVPPSLMTVIKQAIAHCPKDRPADVLTFARMLQPYSTWGGLRVLPQAMSEVATDVHLSNRGVARRTRKLPAYSRILGLALCATVLIAESLSSNLPTMEGLSSNLPAIVNGAHATQQAVISHVARQDVVREGRVTEHSSANSQSQPKRSGTPAVAALLKARPRGARRDVSSRREDTEEWSSLLDERH